MVAQMIEIKLDVESSKTTAYNLLGNENDHECRIDVGGNVAGINRFTADDVVPIEAWQGESYKCGERGHAVRHCPDVSFSKIG